MLKKSMILPFAELQIICKRSFYPNTRTKEDTFAIDKLSLEVPDQKWVLKMFE